MNRRFSSVAIAGGIGMIAPLALALPGPAGQAAISQGGTATPATVGVQPASGTPHFPLGTPHTEQIRQLVQCGGVMYAVGSFSTVQQGSQTFTRNNAFSFSATAPFTITSWNPNVNGVVDSITFNRGHCADAYIGGNFSRVRGRRANRIAEVRTAAAGGLVTSFRHSANKEVETLASYQGHVLAGGFFTTINGSSADRYMTSLNATTGSWPCASPATTGSPARSRTPPGSTTSRSATAARWIWSRGTSPRWVASGGSRSSC
jgi:hypothetical protein